MTTALDISDRTTCVIAESCPESAIEELKRQGFAPLYCKTTRELARARRAMRRLNITHVTIIGSLVSRGYQILFDEAEHLGLTVERFKSESFA
jgi:hypothetical protein